jgi:uncharacterized protein
MTDRELIAAVAADVKDKMTGEASGHDWWHVYRVWKLAERLAEQERADHTVVALGALLHDIADWKDHGGDSTVGPRVTREMLEQHGAAADVVDRVATIVGEVSYKGADAKDRPSTVEGQAVQDADRLDAIGAIGIARVFTFGGHRGRLMFDPENETTVLATMEEYAKIPNSSSVKHFYDKLLLLKDRMNTAAAKAIAAERHAYMEQFLERFYAEWEGKK